MASGLNMSVWSLHWWWSVVTIMIFLMLVSSAQSQEQTNQKFCNVLSEVFTKLDDKTSLNTLNTLAIIAPDPAFIADKCMVIRPVSGGNIVHCRWKFKFRDDAAKTSFQNLKQAIKNCFPETKENIDQPVNHPDTYEQLAFELENGRIGISLKDKTAAQNTYVFMSLQN